MSIVRVLSRLTLLTLGLAAAGCGEDPIIGQWASPEPAGTNREHNTMEVDEDLRGTGRVYFSIDGQPYYADFDLEAEAVDDGYEIEWSCDGDCGDLDFTMECELSGDDDDELDCTGDGLWRDFEFEWEKDR
jgi:hypothetical protein